MRSIIKIWELFKAKNQERAVSATREKVSYFFRARIGAKPGVRLLRSAKLLPRNLREPVVMTSLLKFYLT